MARNEARLAVSIWTDRDFLALGPGAQRLFMYLISQPDLTHDGVLALRVRRWSLSAAGLSSADVATALDELSTARFVVVDEDTEELVIRSLIRRDKVYRQPNVLLSAADHLATVSSPKIHRAIAAELARIEASGDLPETSRKAFDQIRAVAEKGSRNPSGKGPGGGETATDTHGVEMHADSDASPVSAGSRGSGNPSVDPSGNPSAATPGERGMVRPVVSASPYPGPRSPDPDPRSLAPAALASLGGEPVDGEIVNDPPPDPATVALFAVPAGTDLEPTEPSNAGQLNRQWIDYCRANGVKLSNSVIKRYGGKIRQALVDGFEARLVKHALGAMFNDRVASRPALLDSYLVRVQQGPELPPERLSRHQADAERRAPAGQTAAQQLYDTLTRPA